jgi:uncharacterized membrane protein YphA (DoxX/SURF4 family)
MNPNPLFDVIIFLIRPGWLTTAFWALLILSIVFALYTFTALRDQRDPGHVGRWMFRLLVGAMWWQQSLWKLPPFYTDQPNEPFGTTGLAYWMGLMGKHAAIPLQADIVNQIVLPNFYLFAPIVYGLEVATAVSLMLGLFTRLFGYIGALQILNLWLGLYSAPGEWPWTYVFLLLLMLIFAIGHYGQSLGIDAIIATRLRYRASPGVGRRLLEAIT